MSIEEEILQLSQAKDILKVENIQSLWSGYGVLQKYLLDGGKHKSLIVKHINWEDKGEHPRGWNSDISHQRKLKSYQVEYQWYKQFTHLTNNKCRTAQIYHSIEKETEMLLIMEDLDEAGYHLRKTPNNVSLTDAKNCLEWLANFHGKFMSMDATTLWPIGSYWHLNTRPDEYNQMENRELKSVAAAIDARLNSAKYQTIIHGDAKLANFCFSDSNKVSAVDFQYVGKGCGMKDVAYLMSSCFSDDECELYEQELIDHYFKHLEQATNESIDSNRLIDEWRELYKYAWADFYRFLDGWSPGHWKMHGYSKRLTDSVIEDLSK